MLKQGIETRYFSHLDELFYDRRLAGVRKPEINGFLLTQKLTMGIRRASCREIVTPHTTPLYLFQLLWKLFLSSASPPSLLPDSHLANITSSPGGEQGPASVTVRRVYTLK